MASSNFDACLRRLLAHEGGYSNHPSDPGGPTNFGITLADYRRYVKPGATAADVRAMQVGEAVAIYRAKYWDAMRCDELPAGIDDTAFDYCVNSGLGRSGKVLRRVLGLADGDWHVTADVLAALRRRAASDVITAINDERLRFLRSLKTWPVFGAGWSRRVAEVRAFSLTLAAEAGARASATPTPATRPAESPAAAVPGKGEVPATPSVRTGAAGGIVVAGGAAAAQTSSGAGSTTLAVAIAIGVVLAAVAGWLALRWWRRRRQERAVAGISVVSEHAGLGGSHELA